MSRMLRFMRETRVFAQPAGPARNALATLADIR
jgi:hypothetical protein